MDTWNGVFPVVATAHVARTATVLVTSFVDMYGDELLLVLTVSYLLRCGVVGTVRVLFAIQWLSQYTHHLLKISSSHKLISSFTPCPLGSDYLMLTKRSLSHSCPYLKDPLLNQLIVRSNITRCWRPLWSLSAVGSVQPSVGANCLIEASGSSDNLLAEGIRR